MIMTSWGAYVRQWNGTCIIRKSRLLDYMFSRGFYCGWGKIWVLFIPSIAAGLQMAPDKALNSVRPLFRQRSSL